MLASIVADLHRAANLPVTSAPPTDTELMALASAVSLDITYRALGLPVIGMLGGGTMIVDPHSSVEVNRMLVAYGVARMALYGARDAVVCVDPPLYLDQRKDRAFLLEGYLLFGLDYEPAVSLSDLREVAELARVPLWFVRRFEVLRASTEARRELWRDPNLGQRARRLAASRGLTGLDLALA